MVLTLSSWTWPSSLQPPETVSRVRASESTPASSMPPLTVFTVKLSEAEISFRKASPLTVFTSIRSAEQELRERLPLTVDTLISSDLQPATDISPLVFETSRVTSSTISSRGRSTSSSLSFWPNQPRFTLKNLRNHWPSQRILRAPEPVSTFMRSASSMAFALRSVTCILSSGLIPTVTGPVSQVISRLSISSSAGSMTRAFSWPRAIFVLTLLSGSAARPMASTEAKSRAARAQAVMVNIWLFLSFISRPPLLAAILLHHGAQQGVHDHVYSRGDKEYHPSDVPLACAKA